jgi:hypothetical protein
LFTVPAVRITAMANEQDFRFNVGDGWLDVTHSEPGNSWVVAYGPFERERNTGGPWLSTANPRHAH